MDNTQTSDTGQGTRPQLWNPSTAANLSVLLTPALGAWIIARNWRELGEPGKAKTSMAFIYIYIAGIAASILLGAGYAAHLPLLIVWYLVCAKPQMKHVKNELPGGYGKRSIMKPAAVALVVMLVALPCIALMAAAIDGGDGGEKPMHARLEVAVVPTLNELYADLHRQAVQLGQIAADAPIAQCKSVKVMPEPIADNVYEGNMGMDDGEEYGFLVQVNEDGTFTVRLSSE